MTHKSRMNTLHFDANFQAILLLAMKLDNLSVKNVSKSSHVCQVIIWQKSYRRIKKTVYLHACYSISQYVGISVGWSVRHTFLHILVICRLWSIDFSILWVSKHFLRKICIISCYFWSFFVMMKNCHFCYFFLSFYFVTWLSESIES